MLPSYTFANVQADHTINVDFAPCGTGVTVQLLDSNGQGLAGGAVWYYDTAWHAFGTTGANGSVKNPDLAPGTYYFAVTYLNAQVGTTQTVDANSTVTFNTQQVTIKLQDSSGQPLDTGMVQLYSGGWSTLGNTANGQVQCELLPADYLFSMTYLNAQMVNVQDVSADATVVFQTAPVHSLSGLCSYVYSYGWQPFTQDMQLPPGTYLFYSAIPATMQQATISSGVVNDIQ